MFGGQAAAHLLDQTGHGRFGGFGSSTFPSSSRLRRPCFLRLFRLSRHLPAPSPQSGYRVKVNVLYTHPRLPSIQSLATGPQSPQAQMGNTWSRRRTAETWTDVSAAARFTVSSRPSSYRTHLFPNQYFQIICFLITIGISTECSGSDGNIKTYEATDHSADALPVP